MAERRNSVTDLVNQYESNNNTRLSTSSTRSIAPRTPTFVSHIENINLQRELDSDNAQSDNQSDQSAPNTIQDITDNLNNLIKDIDKECDNETNLRHNTNTPNEEHSSTWLSSQEHARITQEKLRSVGKKIDSMRETLMSKVDQIEVPPLEHIEMESSQYGTLIDFELKETNEPSQGQSDKEKQKSELTIKHYSIMSSTSSDSNDNDDYYNHTYVNLCHLPLRRKQSDDEPPPLPPRSRSNTNSSNASAQLYDPPQNPNENYDYVTITMYQPVSDVPKMRAVNLKSKSSLQYKTLLTVFNDEQLTRQSISKVMIDEDQVEQELLTFKDKKEYIIDELINTEEDYITNMQFAIYHYKPYLNTRIGSKDTKIIFHDLHDIMNGTKMMLYEIKDVGMDYEAIAITFLNHIELFRKYPTYCRNIKKSTKKCKKYAQLIEKEERELDDRLGLESHLLRPVSRIGKYELLFKRLIKQLEKNNLPRTHVETALNLFQSISSQGNDMVQLEQIAGKTYEFSATGCFIMRNKFKMLSPKKQHVILFLFKQKVIITKKDKNNKDNYIYENEIDMKEIGYTRIDDHLTTFCLYRKSIRGETYRLDAGNRDVKNKWLGHIEDILWEEIREKKRRMTALYN